MLEKGVNLYYIQRSLGHSDIYTTQIYAYVSQKDLQNKINQAFNAKTKDTTAITDPLEVLKIRFANGEIDLREFQEKNEVLKGCSSALF